MRPLKVLLLGSLILGTSPVIADPLRDALNAPTADPIADAWAPDRKKAEAQAAYDHAVAFEYFNSDLVSPAPDPSAASLVLYRKAADLGHVEAQVRLGACYERGCLGVAIDYLTALGWYRKAAAQGSTQAIAKVRSVDGSFTYPGWPPNKSSVPPSSSSPDRVTSGTPNPTTFPPSSLVTNRSLVQMKKEGGTYVVPVRINDELTLDFMVDSGASDVSIPEDVVTTLMRAGTIRDTDFLGERTYVLADGSRVTSKTLRIRSLQVGDRVLENVTGSVAPTNGSLLLGQSFLGRFKSWSIDNNRHVLVLE